MRRVVVLILAVALALPLGALASPVSGQPTASDLLPDLGMAQLTGLRIEKTSDKRKLLRFDSVVVNVGDGEFEVHGERPDKVTPTMTTKQRIYDDEGVSRDVDTPATMYFGGDGHNHWHVRDLERFKLRRLGKGPDERTGAKHGFCFFDNVEHELSLPGAPQSPQYASCGTSGDIEVEMGLSVGWGDLYASSLPDQYVEITGLGRGRYRLTGTADADDWFQETDESNNTTWVDLKIKKGGRVTVTGYGPGV